MFNVRLILAKTYIFNRSVSLGRFLILFFFLGGGFITRHIFQFFSLVAPSTSLHFSSFTWSFKPASHIFIMRSYYRPASKAEVFERSTGEMMRTPETLT